MNKYSLLANISIIAVPLAPAFFFGQRVYTAVIDTGAAVLLAVIVATAAAIGLESIGIIAGHSAITAAQRGDKGKTAAGAAVMLLYILIGLIELWPGIGAVMFLLSGLAYINLAINNALTEDTQQDTAANILAIERKIAEDTHRRQLEATAQQHKHAEKLARIEAKQREPKRTAANQNEPRRNRDEIGTKLTPKQKRIAETIRANPPDATNQAISDLMADGTTPQYIGRVRKQLNGRL